MPDNDDGIYITEQKDNFHSDFIILAITAYFD